MKTLHQPPLLSILQRGAMCDEETRTWEPEHKVAIGHMATANSLAFETAITELARRGGGTVVVPPGLYHTGPIRLKSSIRLHLDRGAELRFIPDFDRYEPVRSRWEGVECFAMAPMVFGSGLENVEICGDGVLNGQGEPWWKEVRRRRANGPLQPVEPHELRLGELNPDYRDHSSGGGGREITGYYEPRKHELCSQKQSFFEKRNIELDRAMLSLNI